MDRLDAKDVSALLAFTADLNGIDDPLPFPPRVLAGLQRLIHSPQVGYSELNPARHCSVLQIWHASDSDEGVDAVERTGELWWSLRHTHPVCGYRTSTGDWTRPLKATDFVPLHAFRRTPIYDAFYRGVLDHWFDFGLPPTRSTTRVFIFTRQREADFDERDRLVATLVRPYLEARAAQLEIATRAAAALAAVEDGAGEGPHNVVLCSPTGAIEFASRASRRLLARYLGIDGSRLPRSLLVRAQTFHDDAHGELTVQPARVGVLRVLLLGERDTRLERLTPREREILERAAIGQENEVIAGELGVANATVAKHLEHVYAKLGVPNRTAAAALVGHPRLAGAARESTTT